MEAKTGKQYALDRIDEAARTGETKLDLSQLALHSLPEEIGKLTNLTELILFQNELTDLPFEITLLPHLTKLNLYYNRFTSFPHEITRLTNLTNLDLSYNQLSSLPAGLNKLAQLSELNLARNRFKTFPKEISKLTKLTLLDLWGNRLTTLPPEIGQLTNLVSLNLKGNLLKTLPTDVIHLHKLKILDLRRNELNIPLEILDNTRNPQALIDYIDAVEMRDYLQKIRKAKSLNEIKLLMVGQGSVGKTSLIQRILHGTFDLSQTKTEGISINQWQVESSENRETEGQSKIENRNSKIRLNIWDFGGQEIMHATHLFFLTKRSLYLLVLDARLTQEENRVEYWLKIIQSFGGESPVLIVGNKTDQHPLDIDRTGLRKKYPNIVGILETSAATGAGIEALKAEIAKQVDTLPHVRDLLPETWFTVKSKLEELGRDQNFITQDAFLNLCVANDVADETSQHTLIGFLHDLGVVLHFQDDPRLEALGILNPQWVTNGVYKILNSHELFQNKGKLTLPMLNKILSSPEYPKSKHLFIVDMMKKFELCYDIEHDKSFLISDLLPKDEPDTGEWDDVLAFQYHYNVLPSSIISRFIVRMNAFLHETVWRSGVVLKNSGNTALVKADTEERRIYFWVAGDENTRRDFLSAIRMDFDAIHKTIAKIEASEKVPLPAYPKADPIGYTLLLQLEQKDIKTHHVQAGDDLVEITVAELLDGLRLQAQKKIIPLHKKKCDIPIGLIKKQRIDFEKQTQKAGTEELIGILKSNS